MTSRSVICALLVTFAAGCANDPTSTPAGPADPSASSVTGNEEITGVVVMTRLSDYGVDGTTDDTYIEKTSYNRRGNAVLVEQESSHPGLTRRWVTRSSYDRWGNVTAQVLDYAFGSRITRSWLTTTETDEAGRPTRQVYLLDWDSDGVWDHEGNVLAYPAYDAYGRPLQKLTDSDNDADGALETRTTETMTYDSHGNVEKRTVSSDWSMDGSVEESWWDKNTYNEFGAIVQVTSEYFELSQGTASTSTTTSQFDGAGNPIAQTTEVDYAPADGVVNNRYRMTTTFDGQHRPLLQIRNTDIGADGTVEGRDTITYEYYGTVPKPSGRAIPAMADAAETKLTR